MSSRQDSLVLGLESPNWNMSLYMTQGSTLAISTPQTPTPLNLVATNNHGFVFGLFVSLSFFFSTVFITDKPTHRAFKKWLMDGTAVDKKHLVFSLDHAYEISTAIQIVCSVLKQLSLIASPDIN